MEFQFGTDWAEFSKSAGGVIGQTLAMEGIVSFFLESSFLGLFLFGERRPRPHWPLDCRLSRFYWLMAFRLFNHCDQRLDATSRRLSRPS